VPDCLATPLPVCPDAFAAVSTRGDAEPDAGPAPDGIGASVKPGATHSSPANTILWRRSRSPRRAPYGQLHVRKPQVPWFRDGGGRGREGHNQRDVGRVMPMQASGGRTWIRTTDLFLIRATPAISGTPPRLNVPHSVAPFRVEYEVRTGDRPPDFGGYGNNGGNKSMRALCAAASRWWHLRQQTLCNPSNPYRHSPC